MGNLASTWSDEILPISNITNISLPGLSTLQLNRVYRATFDAFAAAVAIDGIYYNRLLVFMDPKPQSFAESQAGFVTAFKFPNF